MQINTNVFGLLATAILMQVVTIAIYDAGRSTGRVEERRNQEENNRRRYSYNHRDF